MFYTTNFPLTENPINQGGVWTRGGSEGLDWTDPQTGPNSSATGQIAFGKQTIHAPPPFDDSIAHLSGFASDHYAEGVIFNAATDQIEVELFTNLIITPHSARGYEADYVFSGVNSCNVSLVRWNGAAGSFTVLNGGNPVVVGLNISTGTIHRVTRAGNIITGKRNGATIFTYDLQANFVADGSLIWSNGNPGMGFWDASLAVSADRNQMGWSTFTADDGISGSGGGGQFYPGYFSPRRKRRYLI